MSDDISGDINNLVAGVAHDVFNQFLETDRIAETATLFVLKLTVVLADILAHHNLATI